VINRAVARLTLFEKQEDYEAFERVLRLAHERVNLGILAYCVMPNHWHFVVRGAKKRCQVRMALPSFD
jgi:putative transposase